LANSPSLPIFRKRAALAMGDSVLIHVDTALLWRFWTEWEYAVDTKPAARRRVLK
jgi:hypothetical protein